MKTVEQIQEENRRFINLCQITFSSGQGAELLELMKRIYVDVRMMHSTDRDTVYAVAQRDLIMEIENHSKFRMEDNHE